LWARWNFESKRYYTTYAFADHATRKSENLHVLAKPRRHSQCFGSLADDIVGTCHDQSTISKQLLCTSTSHILQQKPAIHFGHQSSHSQLCKANSANTCIGGVRPALLIDSSTIDPPTARELNAAATAAALHHDARPCSGCSAAHPTLIDAPVSGGITGASKATLTFMVRARMFP